MEVLGRLVRRLLHSLEDGQLWLNLGGSSMVGEKSKSRCSEMTDLLMRKREVRFRLQQLEGWSYHPLR